jgi:hypothetical protein
MSSWMLRPPICPSCALLSREEYCCRLPLALTGQYTLKEKGESLKVSGLPVGYLPKTIARKISSPAAEKPMVGRTGSGFCRMGIFRGRIAIFEKDCTIEIRRKCKYRQSQKEGQHLLILMGETTFTLILTIFTFLLPYFIKYDPNEGICY